MKRDYKFWFDLIIVIVALASVIISIISLIKSSYLDLELREFKADFIEVVGLTSINATIENINGVNCIIFSSGGEICASR